MDFKLYVIFDFDFILYAFICICIVKHIDLDFRSMRYIKIDIIIIIPEINLFVFIKASTPSIRTRI